MSNLRSPVGVLMVITLPVGLSGCGPRWRPTMKIPTAQSKPAAEQFSIEPYLRAWRLGFWTYQRAHLDHTGPAGQTYVRLCEPDRMIEGKLVGRDFRPLNQYLHPGTADAAGGEQLDAGPPAGRHPVEPPPLKGGKAFLFELVDAIEPIPAQLRPGAPISTNTPLLYFDFDGRALSKGTLTRNVEIEGFDDIDGPAGRFPGCLRVRVDLNVHLPWTLSLDWTSYLWLSAKTGEVRRIQQMSGWFLIFWFSSAHQYDLTAGGTLAARRQSSSPRRNGSTGQCFWTVRCRGRRSGGWWWTMRVRRRPLPLLQVRAV